MHSPLDWNLAYPWRPMSRSHRDQSLDLIQDLIQDQTPDLIQDLDLIQDQTQGPIPDLIQDQSRGLIQGQTLDPIRDQVTPTALGTPTDLDTRTVFRVMSTSALVPVMRTRDRLVTRTRRATQTSNPVRM
jgi:hypothetical protein